MGNLTDRPELTMVRKATVPAVAALARGAIELGRSHIHVRDLARLRMPAELDEDLSGTYGTPQE